jgi:hypothetical protein
LRAWAIAGTVEDNIRVHPDLDGAQGVTAALVTDKTIDSYSTDMGILIELVIHVTVRSKI